MTTSNKTLIFVLGTEVRDWTPRNHCYALAIVATYATKHISRTTHNARRTAVGPFLAISNQELKQKLKCPISSCAITMQRHGERRTLETNPRTMAAYASLRLVAPKNPKEQRQVQDSRSMTTAEVRIMTTRMCWMTCQAMTISLCRTSEYRPQLCIISPLPPLPRPSLCPSGSLTISRESCTLLCRIRYIGGVLLVVLAVMKRRSARCYLYYSALVNRVSPVSTAWTRAACPADFSNNR